MSRSLSLLSWQAPLAVAGGTLALFARAPSSMAIAVTASVGVVGGMVGLDTLEPRTRSRLRWLAITSLGTAPFFVASEWIMSNPLPRAAASAIVISVIAAVAEEIFFRRLVYGWLQPRWGVALAIVVSAALFTLVHLPVYGLGVLPLDFAAGLIFGWQRWATGSWTAPAATHAAANILALV